MGAVAWGEQTVPSGIAALLIAMMPVWVAIFGGIFFHERLPLAAALGIVDRHGSASRSSSARRSPSTGRSIRRASSPCSSRRSAGPRAPVRRAPGGAAEGPVRDDRAPDAERRDRPGRRRGRDRRDLHRSTRPRSPSESLIALVYLTLVGSLVAFTAYAWVLRHAPLPLIATYAFVNPVVAVVLGSHRPRRDA